MKISGKTAVITGGNSGIGFGIARRLADEGATGIIIGRNQQILNDASNKLDGAFLPIKCDVTQIESLESAFKNAEEQFGGIDVLVVNAAAEVSDIKSGFKDIIPMHRTGTADEMGGVAVFLASSDSSFVVGEEIVADGGVVNL